MLGSIEIENLSGDHFEIAFGATMPAAQIAAVEADHDRRGHCVDLGIWCSGRTQLRNTLVPKPKFATEPSAGTENTAKPHSRSPRPGSDHGDKADHEHGS